VTPVDKEFDSKVEEARGASAIGTTRRGIGPSYAMRALRLSPRVIDLITGYDLGALARFYEEYSLDTGGLAAWGDESRALLQGMVGDVALRVNDITDGGGKVLFEASQGTLLDLLHGTYPFVTATHTTVSYVPAALGISPRLAGTAMGVMKCYATRVGAGPFPSEIRGQLAENLRTIGNEYGATTGRPRRVGWLDLVSLRYAIRLNGVEEVAITKLDVLSQVREPKVCTAYRVQGAETTDFQRVAAHMGESEPVLEPGPSLQGADFSHGLTDAGKEFVQMIEDRLDVRVRLISHGEDRSKTIEL
ncbi:MAG TPA: adenylosuccinate synthetase, partial [Nitrososphaerales archaeon]|nr:adenylosuccinate synthetase [Nitrososphaerales archaeon]